MKTIYQLIDEALDKQMLVNNRMDENEDDEVINALNDSIEICLEIQGLLK